MSDSDLNVLHVVGTDTPPARLETLKALYARPDLGRQRIVRFPGHRLDYPGLGAIERRPLPFGLRWLASRRLRSAIPPTESPVLHIWSPMALAWLPPAAMSGKRADGAKGRVRDRLLVDLEVPLDSRRLASGLSRLRSEATLRFVCPTNTVRRRLAAIGLPTEECVLIRDSVDFAAIEAARGHDVRSRLGLSPEHTVVLVLPPVLHETGALVAAWATMLLGQVRPDVRLIVPDAGREVDRVARLVESCGHQWILRLVGRRFALCELLAATDLAICLPPGHAPLTGVAWAMATGRPIVASAVPATTELLVHGQNAWLCQADNPKDAARSLLQALENPQQSQRQAELARSQAFQLFGRLRMIEQYRRAYGNLLADRCIADGIEDAALIR